MLLLQEYSRLQTTAANYGFCCAVVVWCGELCADAAAAAAAEQTPNAETREREKERKRCCIFWTVFNFKHTQRASEREHRHRIRHVQTDALRERERHREQIWVRRVKKAKKASFLAISFLYAPNRRKSSSSTSSSSSSSSGHRTKTELQQNSATHCAAADKLDFQV